MGEGRWMGSCSMGHPIPDPQGSSSFPIWEGFAGRPQDVPRATAHGLGKGLSRLKLLLPTDCCVRGGQILDRELFPDFSGKATFLISPLHYKKKKSQGARDVYLPHDRTPRDYFWILLQHVKRPDSIKEVISSFPSTGIHARPKIKPDFPRLVQSCAELGNMQSRQVFIESHPRLLSKVVFSQHICLEDFAVSSSFSIFRQLCLVGNRNKNAALFAITQYFKIDPVK